jgi:hypothetical protein
MRDRETFILLVKILYDQNKTVQQTFKQNIYIALDTSKIYQ